MTDRRNTTWIAAFVLVGVVVGPALAGADWTQWGGPDRDFKVEASGLAAGWPESGPERSWARELGLGYAAVLYEEGRLYATHRSGTGEAVTALDADTGETLWNFDYAAEPFENQTTQFGGGPNATPLIVGDRLYAIGFTSILHCLDKRDGKLLWTHDLVEEFGGTRLQFGYAASPVRYGDMVVVLVGGERHGAVGFDLQDGSVRWSSAPTSISYASPSIIDVDGQDQLVFMTPTEVVGVDLKQGQVRWRYPHENQYQNNCAGPWWGEGNLLFVSSQGDVGSRTLKLTREGERTVVEEIASSKHMKVFHNTALRIGDVVYAGSHDLLVAYDLRTGKILWRERGFSEANLVLAGRRAIVLDEQGWLALVTLGPDKLTIHASAKVLEKPAWTAPTLVGTRLFVRGKRELLAFDLGRAGPE